MKSEIYLRAYKARDERASLRANGLTQGLVFHKRLIHFLTGEPKHMRFTWRSSKAKIQSCHFLEIIVGREFRFRIYYSPLKYSKFSFLASVFEFSKKQKHSLS